MKLASLLIGVLLFSTSLCNDIPAHIKSYTQNISNQCKIRSKVTEEDMKVIKSYRIPTTQTGKCYLQCLLEKMGIIYNGKYRKTGVLATFDSLLKGKPDYRKSLKKIADKCEKEIGSDPVNEPCGLAVKIFECLKKYENRINVRLPTQYL